MGVVNVTPNSFSDGGDFLDPDAAAEQARHLVAQGARVIDLGAEASSFFRPGVEPVPAEEQLGRLLPVLERLRDLPPEVLISVDTRSAQVAEEAIRAGAAIINDISAGTHDQELLPTVARAGASMILMHMSPNYPATPESDDRDIVATVRAYLAGRAAAAMRVGIAPERIALDPGVGFGKTMADNWRLALRAQAVGSGFPVVLGVSRKRFLETAPPPDVPLPPQWGELLVSFQAGAKHPRDPATAALTTLAVGVPIHRVHAWHWW